MSGAKSFTLHLHALYTLARSEPSRPVTRIAWRSSQPLGSLGSRSTPQRRGLVGLTRLRVSQVWRHSSAGPTGAEVPQGESTRDVTELRSGSKWVEVERAQRWVEVCHFGSTSGHPS